jgi:hypothetical protein
MFGTPDAASPTSVAPGPVSSSSLPSQPEEESSPNAAVPEFSQAESVVSWGEAMSGLSDDDDAIE